MGVPEETGKVATSIVEGLKTSPSCLAAIILAAMFALLTFYALQRDADRRSKTVDTLLAHCVFPGPDKPVRGDE